MLFPYTHLTTCTIPRMSRITTVLLVNLYPLCIVGILQISFHLSQYARPNVLVCLNDHDHASWGLQKYPNAQRSSNYRKEEMLNPRSFCSTYAHPQKDTLYISSQITPILKENLSRYYKCARPPLYPLAQLDRIAVEFDWDDLLYSSPLLQSYYKLFAEFGSPKELLVVTENGEGPGVTSSRIPELKKIGFLEGPDIYSMGSNRILEYLNVIWDAKDDDVSWFRESFPTVKLVRVITDAETWIFREKGLNLLVLANESARYWQEMEFEVHGREWNFDMDGSPYDQVNMNKALAKVKDRYSNPSRPPEIINRGFGL